MDDGSDKAWLEYLKTNPVLCALGLDASLGGVNSLATLEVFQFAKAFKGRQLADDTAHTAACHAFIAIRRALAFGAWGGGVNRVTR